MPEGHTIHRLALDHTRDLVGHTIKASSPQGRFVEGAATLDQHVLLQVEALGKHLFYWWDDAPTLHIHLGLIGSFGRFASPPPAPRQSVRLRLESPIAAVDLVGATTCEFVDQQGYERVLTRVGPDLLAGDADPELAFQRLTRRAIPIGVALLDQQSLSGVGNVYRAEALFVNGIHPERPANTLTRPEFDALWQTLVRMLHQGVEDRRIITVHPSERGDGDIERITPEDAFYIYKQRICRRCGTAVRSWPLGARRAYACEQCQPLQLKV